MQGHAEAVNLQPAIVLYCLPYTAVKLIFTRNEHLQYIIDVSNKICLVVGTGKCKFLVP